MPLSGDMRCRWDIWLYSSYIPLQKQTAWIQSIKSTSNRRNNLFYHIKTVCEQTKKHNFPPFLYKYVLQTFMLELCTVASQISACSFIWKTKWNYFRCCGCTLHIHTELVYVVGEGAKHHSNELANEGCSQLCEFVLSAANRIYNFAKTYTKTSVLWHANFAWTWHSQ